MRVVFCGSPDFAEPSLRAVNKNFQVVGVFTQPDRVNGKKVVLPHIKNVAIELGLPVFQPNNISKDGFETLVSLKPDVIVTCAFGQFLFRKVLNLAPFGVINVHGSILPKYRGASPVQSAILNGESETGVSIMRTAFEMDAGEVMFTEKISIKEGETAGELFDRMAEIGANALVKGLKMIENEEAVFTPQDHSQATYCEKLKKDYGLIDFSKSAKELDCFVRGLNPWPSAYAFLPSGKIFKIHGVEILEETYSQENGTVVACDKKNGLIVSLGVGSIRLLSVQEEGGKKMDALTYVIGHNILGVKLRGKTEN